MLSRKALLDLVSKIYDAASDPTLWTSALGDIAAVVRAPAAALDFCNFASAASQLAVAINVNQPREYELHYAPKNILYQRGAHLLKPGAVLTNEMLCPVAEYLRSEYYNDFLRRSDICHMMGGAIMRHSSAAAVISVSRPPDHAPFETSDRHVLEELMPHLRRALQLHEHLALLKSQERHAAGALDMLTVGVIVVDDKCKIRLMNRSAEKLLGENDGLSAGPEGIRTWDRMQGEALRAMVRGAAATAAAVDATTGGALSIRRPSSHRDYVLLVCPMRPSGAAPALSDAPSAVIFITDPETRCESPSALLARLYRLTPAECRVATMLMTGKTLVETAEELGVSRNTAHSQLMAVFGKTGTRRQSELIKLLVNGPAQVRMAA